MSIRSKMVQLFWKHYSQVFIAPSYWTSHYQGWTGLRYYGERDQSIPQYRPSPSLLMQGRIIGSAQSKPVLMTS